MKSQSLKTLVKTDSYDQIDACIQQQLAKGQNECNSEDSTNAVIEVLSKARVVRERMDRGINFSRTLHELGCTIRGVYGSEQEAKKCKRE